MILGEGQLRCGQCCCPCAVPGMRQGGRSAMRQTPLMKLPRGESGTQHLGLPSTGCQPWQRLLYIIIFIIIIIITIITLLFIMYNNCMDDVINIVTRTLPATYVYGIYRHAHSARHVRIWDLSSRALCPPRTYMGFIVTRQAME